MKKENFAVLGMVVVSTIYGLSFLATRTVVTHTTPLSLLSWRFTLSFIIMSILCLARVIKLNLRGKNIVPLIMLGVFQPVLSYFFETLGISLTSSSESGLMVSVSPVVTMVLAAIIIRVKPTKLQTAAIIVSVIGVAAVIMGKATDGFLFNPLGYIALMINIIAGALFQIFGSKYKDYAPAEKTYIMMAMGAVSFSVAALIENLSKGTMAQWLTLPFQSVSIAVALLYLSLFCSVIAFMLHNYAINTIGATRCASFGGLVTVLSVIAGVFILHETLTWVQLIGAVLVIGGVYAVNYSGKAE